jgi:hypothetical protein
MSIVGVDLFGSSNFIIIEDESLRSSTLKVFSLENGNQEYNYYNEPVHFYNSAHYSDFDNSYHVNGSYLETVNSNYTSKIPLNLNSDSVITLNYMNYYSLNINYGFEDPRSGFTYPDSYSETRNSSIYNELLNLHGEARYNYNSKSVTFNQSPLGFVVNKEIAPVSNIIRSEYTISSANLKLDNSKGNYEFMDLYGISLFEMSNNYLLNSEGVKTNPTSFTVSFNSISSTYTISTVYDLNTSFDPLLSYYTVSQIIPIINTIPDYIVDKYVKVGYADSYDLENIYVGTSPLTSLPPNSNTPVRIEYRGYYDLKYPLIPYTNLVSATLSLTKATGIYPGISSLSIAPTKVTNLTYDEITGQSNIISTAIGTTNYSASSSSINLNLTSAIRSNLEIGVGNLVVQLRGLLPDNTYANTKFVNIESVTVAKRPNFVIVAEFTPDSSQYGSAGTYVPTSSTSFNCFSYVLDYFSSRINLFDFINPLNPPEVSLFYYQYFIIPHAMVIMAEYNFDVRYILTINSSIVEYERRIAMRIGHLSTFVYEDFHFMKEHGDGSWSHKPGMFPSILLGPGINPNNGSWGSTIYDSPIAYFAINHI